MNPYLDVDPDDGEPEQFRSLVYGAPNSERVRWYMAVPDLTFSRASGTAAPGGVKWDYVEQTLARQFRALIGGTRIVKRYLPQAEVQSGDVTITSMPDELPIASHDQVVPIGRVDGGIANLPDARMFVYKELLVRGAYSTPGVGAVSSSGTVVTGVGTAFTSAINVGDVVTAARQGFRVETILTDGSLVLEAAPSPAWASNSFTVSTERLRLNTAVSIDLIQDDGTVYRYPRDVQIAADQQTLRWTSVATSPVVGAAISVIYRYLPRYIVLPECGTRRHTVNGVPMPQTVVARIWTPDQFKPQ